MQMHELDIVIPENHRLVIDVPKNIDCGPARLILLTDGERPTVGEQPSSRGRGRMAALHSELAKDPRPFRELSSAERRARLRRVKGAARDLLASRGELPSEEFAKGKRREIELEERKFAR